MSGPEGASPWRPCVGGRYQLAEGARWAEGGLLFVDLLRGDLYRSRDCSGGPPERVLRLGMPLGAAARAPAGASAGWIVAAGPGIALLHSGAGPHWLARPGDRPGRAMRMNDGGCDPSGRFWAGSMDAEAAPGAGSLYRTDHDGTVHETLDGLTVPNGPAFSGDGRVMYLADSAHGTISRYAVDVATGGLMAGEPFATVPPSEGRPDGMTVDVAGNLWVALWGGGQVRCYRPDGAVLLSMTVPTPHPSSVAFGGGRMFVTTARHRLDLPGPLAGAVLARPTRVVAPAAVPFGRAG
ncbi:SMP-30/gluconolactonase/LRE family protein [Streptomyces gardneri]|uniref:SMP-30/gluconolactonase/LRE family protein n=1 Tax=Streptomyces gardneri TaxID=66892 RepID=UPI0006E30779|nr:SMP-30/gluconolactonase/LRE family protein [Streptomyces gardneri]QPK43452.1 SMP-30/gluconolactonase/LRE family protein [Streptomyces gardneri]WRK34684.1 SMP-30/gluconolactonase/LRE family protein [Streptomyces venezuelae]